MVVIVPVKSFRTGKQRLSAVLSPDRHDALVRALADHVASTIAASGLVPLIVTADAEVAIWATGSGFPSLPDAGTGLDAAAAAGVEWAGRADSPWLVIHADLPFLTVADLAALDAELTSGGWPIAPSSDGGTSAIGGRGAFAFQFGAGSFHRHISRLPTPRVVFRRGLAFDVDTVTDLETLGRVGGDRWVGWGPGEPSQPILAT